MNFTIDKALPEDMDGVFETEKSAFPDPWSKDGLTAALSDRLGIFLAAHDADGGICGYIIGNCDGFSGYIEKIAAAEHCRRAGIGHALLTAFDKSLPDTAESISLEVRLSNKAALALYRGYGFEQAGIRKGFYSSPREDAAVMIYNRK